MASKLALLKIIKAYEKMYFKGEPIITTPSPNVKDAYKGAGLYEDFEAIRRKVVPW